MATATDKPQAPAVKFSGAVLRETRDELRERLTAAGEDLTPPRERAAREGLAPRTQAQIQSEMDPQEWACRSTEHSWAQLGPGAIEIPAGMRVRAAAGGNVLIEWDCLHGCGRFREELCTRNLEIIERNYGTRPGYRHVVIHRDESMTKTQMRAGTYSSNKKLLDKAVKAAKAEAKEAARATRAAS